MTARSLLWHGVGAIATLCVFSVAVDVGLAAGHRKEAEDLFARQWFVSRVVQGLDGGRGEAAISEEGRQIYRHADAVLSVGR